MSKGSSLPSRSSGGAAGLAMDSEGVRNVLRERTGTGNRSDRIIQ